MKLMDNQKFYLINPLSISTITRAIMSKMNGKYIIKESTAVAVQYFLIHQALGLGSGAVWFSLIGKCFWSKSSSSFMNWQVSFLQIVQSSGVPLIIAVGATTIPAKIQEGIKYFKVLALQVIINCIKLWSEKSFQHTQHHKPIDKKIFQIIPPWSEGLFSGTVS